MNIINIIRIMKKYKFSIPKIVFHEIFYILSGFKGNKVNFISSNDFSAKDDLKIFSNLHLVDFEIINTRGYYIYSN